MFTDQAGRWSTKGREERKQGSNTGESAHLRWSTCPLLARQDFTPVVILEYLFLSFIFPLWREQGISVAPTVMSFSLDCLFSMMFCSLSLQPWCLLVKLTAHTTPTLTTQTKSIDQAQIFQKTIYNSKWIEWLLCQKEQKTPVKPQTLVFTLKQTRYNMLISFLLGLVGGFN